jgi:CheY-like chemotaxis protein
MRSERIKLVMLVDDNDTDNFISRKIIEIAGFCDRVEMMSSGKKALEYLEREKNHPDQLPDLIFLDINMPVVDGFVFLYEFDKFPSSVKEKCKVAVLSSSNNKSDVKRIMENPYVIRFITKPLSTEALATLPVYVY